MPECLYEVEWGGFLTNHLSHGRWAMAQIGTPEALQQRYTELYKTRLTALATSQQRPQSPTLVLTEAEVGALRGTRQRYADQRAFFAEEIQNKGGVNPTLLHYLPQLLRGLAGAALHPIIHLAIGLRTGSDGLVAEGLAYLNHSYLPAEVEIASSAPGGGSGGSGGGGGGGSATVPTAAAAAAAAGVGGGGGQYVDAALAQTPAPAVAASGRFQRAMAGLLGSPAAASVLRGASVGLGFTVQTMLDKAVQLYVDDGRNDYFLLHVVTASWGLGVVLDAVPGLPDQTKHEAVEGLAVAAVAATWTQQVDLEKLAAASRTRKNAHAVMIGTQPSAALKAVQVQTAKLCTEPEPRNEHVYKLVAVVTERLQQLGGINSGRSSDGLRVNLAAEDMVDAVALAMSSDFTGRGIGEKPTTKVDLGEASASMHQLVVGVE